MHCIKWGGLSSFVFWFFIQDRCNKSVCCCDCYSVTVATVDYGEENGVCPPLGNHNEERVGKTKSKT